MLGKVLDFVEFAAFGCHLNANNT